MGESGFTGGISVVPAVLWVYPGILEGSSYSLKGIAAGVSRDPW